MAYKKILYLHIGTHKTGTTSIQSYLWDNRRNLNEVGIAYPEIGLSGSTHADFVNCQDFPRREQALKHLIPDFTWNKSPYAMGVSKTKEELFDQLKNFVEHSNCSNFVMSSECFYEWTEPEKFSNRFCAIFDKVYVVVYLRPQIDWIRSVYNQLVKDSYFKYAGGVIELPQIQLLKYYEILQRWEQAFGKGSVLARPYVSDDSFNVIHDFLGVIGIDHNTHEAGASEHIFENKSIPPQYVEMLKEINGFPVSNEYRDKLVQLLQNQEYDTKIDEEIRLEIDVRELAQIVDINNTKLFNYFFEGRNPWHGYSDPALRYA